MNPQAQSAPVPRAAFVFLMASMSSLVALSIDTMLPALPAMGAALGVADANDYPLVISVLFLGMSIGTLIYGPVSDSLGRRGPIFFGLALFCAGTLLCLVADNFATMLIGRFIQGLGVAGPRIVSMALVRDIYSGRAMAKVMSLVMVVFILVPALAPLLGQLMIALGGWRMIFVMFLVLSVAVGLWFGLTQPETLPPAQRRAFSLSRIGRAVLAVFRQPQALGYSLAAGLMFGALIGYLSTAQPVLEVLYGLGDRFSIYFGVVALFIGISSWINSRLVMQLGMRYLSGAALLAVTVLSLIYLPVVWLYDGVPPLWSLMVFLSAAFFAVGMLFANYNAMALEPDELAPVAGVAAAVVGSVTTLIAAPIGSWIGQVYDDTVWSLVGGFAALSLATQFVVRYTEKRRSS
ncbi:multidrug effflux MFS transporter [Granulosicoccaceae sp. 1_MG-2023]|nr:multidrug effflux MFS transporter [Granulosicoccaceae sp. 1_MG-2023]